MNATDWPLEFEQVLRTYLPLLSQNEPLSSEVSLAEYGLDSLATVSVLLELEEVFHVMIPDELLVEATFSTPSSLWNVLSELRSVADES